MMKELQLIQGSPEWLAHRANYRNASDTPAVTGSSAYKSRAAFLKERATGIAPEIDAATQRRFDEGHKFEALARPRMEEIIGEDIFPVVGIDGKWSASFDGLTMMGDINAEHKTLNDMIRACRSAADLPAMYREQMEHQMMVSGATKSLFMATKWKLNDSGKFEMEDERHFWYEPDMALRASIIAAWDQFEKDLAAYTPEESKPALVAEVVKDLPAVMVQVTGSVSIVDNFALFESALRDFVDNKLVRSPQTDQDFVDLDEQIKSLKKAEDALDAAEVQMIAQVASVDSMKRTKDMLHKLARDNRLMAEKILKAEKESRKAEIVTGAHREFSDHLALLLKRTGVPIPATGSFAEAVRGLKSLDSMRDKVSVALANAKIEANAVADRIEANKRQLVEVDGMSLFPDFASVCTKLPDDFDALLSMRVNQRRESEAKRLEAERERIRAEEQAKAQREASEKAAAELAERNRIAAEEIRRIDADRKAQPVVEMFEAMGVKVIDATPVGEAKGEIPLVEQKQPVADVSLINEGKTIKLGEICARLGFTVSADFLDSIGFQATIEKSAKTYPEEWWPAMCRRISDHVLSVAFKHPVKLAA
jgi:putative phage-type endonuclease